ncbi:hypothetical protein [Verrucosispora sp. ts21]|uniref:hypothetical protein n=1 Tax=Verrucosispora sp. ts21 TaxID=2069341 RepID=UPI0011AFAAB4|nr:hypothetical protein [Verrucosispora sp. ts21]
MEMVDYSSWTVEAIIAPALKRAMHEGRTSVGSVDLLLEYCRRMGSELPLLGAVIRDDPLSGEREVDRRSEPGNVRPLSVYAAHAILREVAREVLDFRVGRSDVVMPAWTAGVVQVLADARSMSVDKGLPWVGDREVLIALLVNEGSAASALLVRSGTDRHQLLAEVERLSPFRGKLPWAPAVDSLEGAGVLRINMVSRLLMWPVRVISNRVEGRSSGLLSTLEGESSRQAVRRGSGDITFDHVVFAAVSIRQQLVLNDIPEPEGLRGSGSILERYGLLSVDLNLRIVDRGLPPSWAEPLLVPTRPPAFMPEVAMALENLRRLASLDYSYPQILESLFAMPQVRSSIAALTAHRRQ